MKIPKGLRWQPTGKTIGEGGQAQVHLVTDNDGEFQGKWALKVLRRTQPGQALDRFHREIAAIKALDDPGIVQIVDHSEPVDDFQFYVMEQFEDAKPLEKVLFGNENPFQSNTLKALGLFEQICEVLVACESCTPAVVHRDLSPGNVLLYPDGTIKLIDFGLCQIEGQEAITLLDEGVGTQNYMSPECEAGAEGQVSICSDLYSAGKLLWSAITGQRTFSRERAAFNAKSMHSLFPEYPETWHLHHIFEKTIRKNPSDRYSTASSAAHYARRIAYLIRAGHPPLEQIVGNCPICGVGTMGRFEEMQSVYKAPLPRNVAIGRCSYCGHCCVWDTAQRSQVLESRKALR